MTTTEKWAVGDTYYRAIIDHATGCGCEAGPERRTKRRAEIDLEEMVGEFNGRSSAEYVEHMVVDEVDDETGEILSSSSAAG